MREAIFEGFKWNAASAKNRGIPEKKKGKKKG
jgi:hypothetical protein